MAWVCDKLVITSHLLNIYNENFQVFDLPVPPFRLLSLSDRVFHGAPEEKRDKNSVKITDVENVEKNSALYSK